MHHPGHCCCIVLPLPIIFQICMLVQLLPAFKSCTETVRQSRCCCCAHCGCFLILRCHRDHRTLLAECQRLDVRGMHLQHRELSCSVCLQGHAATSKAVFMACIEPTLGCNVDLLIPNLDVICLLGLMQTTHGCGDLIFSSHTTFALVGVLTYTEYGAVVITKVKGVLRICAFKLCCITTYAACHTVLLHSGSFMLRIQHTQHSKSFLLTLGQSPYAYSLQKTVCASSKAVQKHPQGTAAAWVTR